MLQLANRIDMCYNMTRAHMVIIFLNVNFTEQNCWDENDINEVGEWSKRNENILPNE